MRVRKIEVFFALFFMCLASLFIYFALMNLSVNSTTPVVLTEQQAIYQADDWLKTKVPRKGDKPVGLAKVYLLNKKPYYEVGFLDTHANSIEWLGAGRSWDDAFLSAVNVGHLPTCCSGGADWDALNKYLRSLGLPEYKKLPLHNP